MDNSTACTTHRLKWQPLWRELLRSAQPGSRLFWIWVCAFFAYRATTMVGQVLLTGDRDHLKKLTRDYLKRLRKPVDGGFALMANSSSESV